MHWKLSRTECALKVVGVVLVTAAVLKGYQLLSTPTVSTSIWTYRPFLILQVECELALGIWLLSGLFVKAAWLAGLACFTMFTMVTFYKGVIGASSCGCFGSVHVNPWITLLAIDLPVVAALSLCRPMSLWSCQIPLRIWWWYRPVRCLVRLYTEPRPPVPHFARTVVLGLAVLVGTTSILGFHEPAMVSSTYEVLSPKSWVGRRLPVLEHIDINEQLRADIWLVLFYHHDCPDCRKAIHQYQQMAHNLEGNEEFLRIAVVAVPPYGNRVVSRESSLACGRLAPVKEWLINTPSVALLDEANVKAVWEQSTPDLETVLAELLTTESGVVACSGVR